MIRMPDLIMSANHICAFEDASLRRKTCGLWVPNARLNTHRFHPNLADLRRQRTISMCYIKTEVGHAINIERGFGLITPLDMQFARQIFPKVNHLKPAPPLILHPPPG